MAVSLQEASVPPGPHAETAHETGSRHTDRVTLLRVSGTNEMSGLLWFSDFLKFFARLTYF